MSKKFKNKLKGKRKKKKEKDKIRGKDIQGNILNIDSIRVGKALRELEENGYLNYEIDDGDDDIVNIQINAVLALDMFEALPTIPFPIGVYSGLKLKAGHKSRDEFNGLLSVLLSIALAELIKVNGDLNKMKGSVEINDDELAYYSNIITTSYDLDNPTKQGDYYMFNVSEEVIERYRKIAQNQDPRDFAKYHLKQ